MKQKIEALWYGEIAPWERCGAGDPELRELASLMERSSQELKKEITETQWETFQKYMQCADDYTGRMAAGAFCEGFCLAAKLLAEALTPTA